MHDRQTSPIDFMGGWSSERYPDSGRKSSISSRYEPHHEVSPLWTGPGWGVSLGRREHCFRSTFSGKGLDAIERFFSCHPGFRLLTSRLSQPGQASGLDTRAWNEAPPLEKSSSSKAHLPTAWIFVYDNGIHGRHVKIARAAGRRVRMTHRGKVQTWAARRSPTSRRNVLVLVARHTYVRRRARRACDFHGVVRDPCRTPKIQAVGRWA